jgi:flagellar P-ring protein precursor FlgI
MRPRLVLLFSLIGFVLVGAAATPARAERVKDLASIAGVRANHLTGFGIVVGLAGTGDDASSPVVRRSLAKLLTRLGVTVDAAELKAKNAAAVVVTAELPAFARAGAALDVTVSSMGSAKSLAGGELIATPLKGPDGKTWAVAQGSLSLGGFIAEGSSGSSSARNHATVGQVPGGAVVEGTAPSEMPAAELTLMLDTPDFTTASRLRAAIEGALGDDAPATTRDAGTVVVTIGEAYRDRAAELIATIEQLDVVPDTTARVVLDERSGVIVLGQDVVLHAAVVTFGALTIEIAEAPEVAQPAPLAGGDTAVVARSEVSVAEAGGELRVVPAATTVADVAAALATLGAKPRELVAVLRALRTARALRADLVTQ